MGRVKIRLKGIIWGSRNPLLKFWDPLIAREQLKVETSNLARRRTVVSSNKKWKYRSKGVICGHITYFWNFEIALISRELLEVETLNLARRRTTMCSNCVGSYVSESRSREY